MLLKQSPAQRKVGARAIGQGLDDDGDRATPDVDREQSDAEQAAQAVHAAVLVAPAPRTRHGKVNLVRRTQAVDGLQHQF